MCPSRSCNNAVALWRDSFGYRLTRDRLFDPRHTPPSGDRILEPYVHLDDYRHPGREFFASKQFRPFTKGAFSEIFEDIVREDADVEL